MTPGWVRLSAGIEYPDDILADFAQSRWGRGARIDHFAKPPVCATRGEASDLAESHSISDVYPTDKNMRFHLTPGRLEKRVHMHTFLRIEVTRGPISGAGIHAGVGSTLQGEMTDANLRLFVSRGLRER